MAEEKRKPTDDTRLGKQLADLENTDPKVRKAAEDLDRFMYNQHHNPNYLKPIDEWTFDEDE